jgi:hypothetical protein
MTTTPLVKSLTDEQLDDLRHTILSQPGQSLPEALGLPPETRLVDTGICSPMTIKRGRRIVEVRHG